MILNWVAVCTLYFTHKGLSSKGSSLSDIIIDSRVQRLQ